VPKAKKARADSSAKVARTEANKARRAARMKRHAASLKRRADAWGTHKGESHKTYKNRIRRTFQNERAVALGFPNHATRRKVEKARGKRLMPRRDADFTAAPVESVA
jgi:hypothetical protein